MKLAEGIRRHGFRKWYERQLLQSHAHMVLTFLCAIGIFAALESASKGRTRADQVTDLLALLLCAAVGLWALRRYLFLLTHAEAVASQAECPACRAYGRLELLQANGMSDDVQVCCRQCRHVWRINA